jgi:hypothetical protein
MVPFCNASAVEFTAQVQKVARAKPDGVMIWGAATPADAQVLKQLVGAGYDGPITGDVAYTLPFIPEIAGAAAEKIVAPSQISYAEPDEQTKAFLDSYRSTYDEPATFLPGNSDIINFLAMENDALRQASTSAINRRSRLADTDRTGCDTCRPDKPCFCFSPRDRARTSSSARICR